MQFDLLGLLTFAGTTGIIAAVLTTGLGWVADGWKSKRSAAHLALQIAVALEGYFMTSGERYARLDLHSRSGGAAGNGGAVGIPDAPAFPSDEGAWRALKKTLRNRAMGFANEVTSGQQYVAFMDDAAHDPSGDDKQRNVRLQISHLCVAAYELARDLRKAYGWEPAEIIGNAIEYMRGEIDRLDASENEADAAAHDIAVADAAGNELLTAEESAEALQSARNRRQDA